ncbi:hypothetical protein K432DRAFT_377995 [Lepidopterella palustris CBS 459.81]|uniref:Uncharacterized protein n=1 Tax=Lepidopterella palustris CBS 459.81 TaxID=1314670 RepID=A0A8E2EK88_9PEZI|nr:hypothetical protein K432DRAFT_377995 [Lepidopterella palustris CBS 459.81]
MALSEKPAWASLGAIKAWLLWTAVLGVIRLRSSSYELGRGVGGNCKPSIHQPLPFSFSPFAPSYSPIPPFLPLPPKLLNVEGGSNVSSTLVPSMEMRSNEAFQPVPFPQVSDIDLQLKA